MSIGAVFQAKTLCKARQMAFYEIFWCLPLFFASVASAVTLNGTVDYVYDGDTLSVTDKRGKRERIRLDHIDAPEIGQRFGREAKAALSTRLRGKAVRVEWSRRDEYGRPVGVVYVGAENINRWLVHDGYAWKYRYSRDMEYKALMESAQRGRRGLWADVSPMDPWACRKRKANGALPAAERVCK